MNINIDLALLGRPVNKHMTMSKYYTYLIGVLLIGCSTSIDSRFPDFKPNAEMRDIDKYVQKIAAENDFSVIFFSRSDRDHGWYKMFASKNNAWMKIEIKEDAIDSMEIRQDPDYCPTRDIITKKPCKPEEAQSFFFTLKRLKVFELPEEEILFKNCKDSSIPDLEDIYIQIISGQSVRNLRYSGSYICSNDKEWESIYRIKELFEKEWFENTKGR